MQNHSLARDHIERARKRLSALRALYGEEAWADVVRESQEVVELALKALLRRFHVEVPRLHDVSETLNAELERFPAAIRDSVPRFSSISRSLRRDRELAFYGSEDLNPGTFYKQADADSAKSSAEWVVGEILRSVEF